MSDKKKHEAVDTARILTLWARLSSQAAAESRQLADAFENSVNFIVELERLREEKKQRREQNKKRMTTGPLPKAKACMDAADTARKEAGKQQFLAEKAAERASHFEDYEKEVWEMAWKKTKGAADAWIKAADAWKEAAEQLS